MFRDIGSAIGVAAVLAALSIPAAAQDLAAIADVIDHQLDAFNDGDVATAWDDASAGIKRMFGSPDAFGRMVENGYPMVWDNAGAIFLDLRTDADGRLWQLVRVTAADGSVHLLDYAMIETPGGWKIDAVVLLPDAGVGV